MELIELTRNSLLVLHFIGLASLLGGFLTQMRAMGAGAAKIVPAMVHGAWTAFATGLLLVGLAEYRVAMGADFEVNHIKIGVKTVVVLIILILVMTNRKKESVKAPVFGAVGGLTLTNVILAVFW
ncbi:MAG: hypothetical protein RIR89_967 [Actinomycetota bacterium]|jgi:hypothetical protein